MSLYLQLIRELNVSLPRKYEKLVKNSKLIGLSLLSSTIFINS